MDNETAAVNAAPKKNRGEECLSLRVGRDLRTALEELADQEGTTVNAYCKTVLDQVVKDPKRGHVLVARLLGEMRKQVDRVRDVGVLSEATAEALLETVAEAAREASQEQPNPAPEPEPKKRPWRLPRWARSPFATLLSGDDE